MANDVLGNAFNNAINNIIKQTESNGSGFTRGSSQQSSQPSNNGGSQTAEIQESSFSNTPWYNMPYEGSEIDSPNISHWKNLSSFDNLFSSNDEKKNRNQAVEDFVTGMPEAIFGARDYGVDATGIPFMADYNGFDPNTYMFGYPAGDTQNPYSQVNYDIEDRNPDGTPREQDNKSTGDLEKEAWDKYFTEYGLGKKYGRGIGDFMENGTFDEWYDAVNSDLLKDFYQGQVEQFGDLSNKDNFQKYWDYYKANELLDVLNNVDLIGEYLGTSAGLTNDIVNYMLNPDVDIIDKEAKKYFGYDPYNLNQDAYNNMYDITKYQVGDTLLQNLLSRGITGDDFLNAFSVDEINDLFAMDPSEYTLSAADSEGSLSSWGKDNYATHDTGFDPYTYGMTNMHGSEYMNAPYIGLADTLTALAGDKLYHRTRQPKQQQQTESE